MIRVCCGLYTHVSCDQPPWTIMIVDRWTRSLAIHAGSTSWTPSIFVAQGRSDRRQTWEGLDLWGIGVRLRENAGRGAASWELPDYSDGFQVLFWVFVAEVWPTDGGPCWYLTHDVVRPFLSLNWVQNFVDIRWLQTVVWSSCIKNDNRAWQRRLMDFDDHQPGACERWLYLCSRLNLLPNMLCCLVSTFSKYNLLMVQQFSYLRIYAWARGMRTSSSRDFGYLALRSVWTGKNI